MNVDVLSLKVREEMRKASEFTRLVKLVNSLGY